MGRCAMTARLAWRQHTTAPAQRGYDAAWRALSLQVRAEEPRCRICGAPSTQTDHITPKARGGTDARSNLRALCDDCHLSVTAHQRASRRRERELHPGMVMR